MIQRKIGVNKVKKEEQFLLQTIFQAIVDKKGCNVVIIDVRKVTDFTDYFIVAEGSVDRHIQAIYREIYSALEQKGVLPARFEGVREGEWIVLDYSEVVVHIFTHEMRMRYALEEVWKEGSLVQLGAEKEISH
jgi:ribosome-associated protein